MPCRLECPENKSFSDHLGSNRAHAQTIQEMLSLFSIPLPISSKMPRLRLFNRCETGVDSCQFNCLSLRKKTWKETIYNVFAKLEIYITIKSQFVIIHVFKHIMGEEKTRSNHQLRFYNVLWNLLKTLMISFRHGSNPRGVLRLKDKERVNALCV